MLELRSQHVQGSDPERRPETGEIVVIEGKCKRNNWRLGKIVTLIGGNDGRCRGAVVKIFDGEVGKYIRRPIERLYPVEVKSKVSVTPDEVEISNSQLKGRVRDENLNISKIRERPLRAAADNGILMRRLAGQY